MISINPDFSLTYFARMYPTICLDFDGTLNQYSGWTGQFEEYDPLPGLQGFLADLTDRGYHLVILTARDESALWEIELWLDRYHVSQYIEAITNRKPPAVMYVDDRAVRFNGDFAQCIADVDAFKAWWDIDGNADAPTPEQVARLGLSENNKE